MRREINNFEGQDVEIRKIESRWRNHYHMILEEPKKKKTIK